MLASLSRHLTELYPTIVNTEINYAEYLNNWAKKIYHNNSDNIGYNFLAIDALVYLLKCCIEIDITPLIHGSCTKMQ